jgi:Protein kinase domain
VKPEQAAQQEEAVPPGRPGGPETGPGPLPPGYRFLRQAGGGRYATVHLCHSETTGHEVAVKVAHVAVASSARRLAAHSELLAAGAAARHPCAVAVEDAGFTPDHRPFVATRFCRGGNAQARLAASGPFPVEDVLVIGVRLALALHASHRAGVLHLDVRPANVLYDENGDALLGDHGVARALQRCAPELGAVFDPMYAAREMFGWEPPGPAADVYGLGATLYALLAGEPAYSDAGRTGWAELYREVLRGELPPPGRAGLPPDLPGFLRRMMSAQPEDRPPLTEVHRVLRAMVPVAYAARVPALEPEPAPELPLPGWDPADDVTPEEEAAQEKAGSEAEAAIRRRNRNRVVAAASVVVVFAAAATALVLTQDNGKGGGKPGGKPDAQHSAAPAQQVPPQDLPDLRPRNVSLTTDGNNTQVTWEPPRRPGPVAGYLVVAMAADHRHPVAAKNAPKDERQAVFVSPPVTSATCYVVSAMIDPGSGELKTAPAALACPKR